MNQGPCHVSSKARHMNCDFELTLSCPIADRRRAQAVLAEAHHLIDDLENELSEFRSGTAIWQLNQAPTHQPIFVSPQVIGLLKMSYRIETISRQAFRVTAKSPVPAQDLKNLVAWDETKQEVWKLDPAVKISFGAIGKGYALDRVRALLEREGFTDFLLNAGGSSQILRGFSAPNEPWTFAWSWKKEDDDYLGICFKHFSGIPLALGVSGELEQGSHIIGKKVGACVSSLVIHPSASDADALSTALFLSGWKQSHQNFAEISQAPALAYVDEAENIYWNGHFQELFGPADGSLMKAEDLNHRENTAETWSSWASTPSVAILAGLFVGLFSWDSAYAQQALDLSKLFGGSEGPSFTPYIYERNELWMLFPLLALLLVFLHLLESKPARPARDFDHKARARALALATEQLNTKNKRETPS